MRARLFEAEATLTAIRTGQVDAVLVSGPGGERVLAIEGASHPYHELLNAMTDGAAQLAPNGTVLFANRRLAEMLHRSLAAVRAVRLDRLVASGAREALGELVQQASGRSVAAEFTLTIRGRAPRPVWVALSSVLLESYPRPDRAMPRDVVLMAIFTDLTERKRAEAVRLRLLERILTAEDRERRRIARELHDETGQSLTALLVGLRAIESQAMTRDVRLLARRLRTVASRTVDEVGRLARGLHPTVLDDLGLAAAVRGYAREFAGTFGTTVDLRVDLDDDRTLPPLVKTTLYRILQEALTNVARHARARVVQVWLRRDGSALTLRVGDDGVGFHPAGARMGRNGLGLHGMRERVALLDGAFKISSSPGHGTAVTATVQCSGLPQRRRRGSE